MSNQTLRLQLIMNAANRMAAPLRAVAGDSKVTAKSLADTKKRIKELEQQSGQIDGYRTLGRQIGVTRSELATAQQTAQKLGREMSATQNPTKAMTREFERAKAVVKELSNKEREMVAKHGQMKSAMNAAGISTKQLSSHQRQLKSSLQEANTQLDRQRQKLDQTAQRQKKFASISKTYDNTMASRGKIAGYGAAAMATGAAGLYKASSIGGRALDFDSEMSKVQALTRLKKDSKELSTLRSQARELGANTAYTATEAAQGQGFLAMAGFTPQAIKAAMPGVLDLAKAGGAEIAEAADIGSNILTGFKLPAEQMGRLGDVMVGTFTRANVDLRMLGETMKYAGPVAAGLNVDLETSAAMAGKLGDAGIQGSMGGTALRAIMGRLAAPPKAAADALNSLGIKTKDAKGNLRELPDILTELHKKTAKLGDATRSGLFKHIAGEEAYAALSVLTDQAGTGKLQELIAILRKTKGEASATAKVMADNALGDLDNLTSALDDLGIQAMETEQGPLRGVIQSITGITQSVGVWMRQNPELASTIARVAVFTAAAAAGGGALLLVTAGLLGPLAAMRMGFGMLVTVAGPVLSLLKALTLGFVRAGIAMMSTPLGWILGAIALIAGAVYLIYKNWDTLVPWLKSVWDRCKAPFMVAWKSIQQALSWNPISLLQSAWGSVSQWFAGVIEPCKAPVMAAWQAIKQALSWSPISLLQSAWGSVSQWFAGAIEPCKTPVMAAWQAIKKALSWSPISLLQSAWGSVSQWFAGVIEPCRTPVMAAWQAIKKALSWSPISLLQSAWGSVSQWFAGVIEPCKTPVMAAWQAINKALSWSPISLLQTAWGSVSQRFAGVIEPCKAPVMAAWQAIKQALSWNPISLLQSAWGSVSQWFAGVIEPCKAPVQSILHVMKQVFAWTPLGLITSNWSSIWSFFDTLQEGAMNKGRAIVSGLIDGITAKWRDLMDAVKSLTKYLPDWVTGGGVTISQESVSGPSYLTGNSGSGLAMAGGGGYAPTMYTPKPLARSTANSTVSVSAPIYIQQQPGQSATSVAQEVSRQLDDRERRARAASRASLGDTH